MKILGAILTMVFIFSCASNKPLASRGLPPEERRYYIIQNGFGISQEVKNAFLEGIPTTGMSKDLIFQLFGPADREINQGDQWEYLDNRGQIVTAMVFEDNIVIELFGDPRGGAPLPAE